MDHHIQAQNVFQLILCPAALLLLTVDQGHRRRSLADNEGDDVAFMKLILLCRGGGDDKTRIHFLAILCLGLVLRLDHQLILLDQVPQGAHRLTVGHAGGQVRHGAHILAGADPHLDGDGQLPLLLCLRIRVLADDQPHIGVARLAPGLQDLEGPVDDIRLIPCLLHRHAPQIRHWIGVRRGGGEG